MLVKNLYCGCKSKNNFTELESWLTAKWNWAIPHVIVSSVYVWCDNTWKSGTHKHTSLYLYDVTYLLLMWCSVYTEMIDQIQRVNRRMLTPPTTHLVSWLDQGENTNLQRKHIANNTLEQSSITLNELSPSISVHKNIIWTPITQQVLNFQSVTIFSKWHKLCKPLSDN